MKKAMTIVLIGILLCTICGKIMFSKAIEVSNNTSEITNISTVVGSYCHNGFVPNSVTFFGGDLIIADKDNHRLSVVDINTSEVIKTYGSYGTGTNNLRFPRALAVYSKELLVCDSYNNRIVFLDSNFNTNNILNLPKEPKHITVSKDNLYILLEDGLTIEKYNLNNLKKTHTFSLKHPAEYITDIDSLLIASGKENVSTINIDDGSYKTIYELSKAIHINTYNEKIYVLFKNKISVYDKDFNKTDEYTVNPGGSYVYPFKESVYIANKAKALVYHYQNQSHVSTYGKGRKTENINLISSKGTLIAAAGENFIDIYREGNVVASIDETDIIDIKLSDNTLFILKVNSILSYELTHHKNREISTKFSSSLNANSSYHFTAMDIKDNNIYISETNNGKILKTSTNLDVFTTVVNRLNKPSSIAYGYKTIYVAEENRLSAYDASGNLVHQTEGAYQSISCNANGLFATSDKSKQIDKFSHALEPASSLKYDGYFLEITDLEAKEYGLYICDYARHEIMIYTNEHLEIKTDNVLTNTSPFDGTVEKGDTLTLNVSGAGMHNFLPNIGAVRYNPVSLGIDTETPFKRDGDRFTANISMQNVGNFTIKVKYQKQIYRSGGWEDIQTADSKIIYELPVTVIENSDDKEKTAYIIQEKILNFFTSLFHNQL